MASSGIQDERVWLETQELCDSIDRSYQAHRRYTPPATVELNRDKETNLVPEGGYVCEYDAQAMAVWFSRG